MTRGCGPQVRAPSVVRTSVVRPGEWSEGLVRAVRLSTSGTGGGAPSPATISKGSFVGSVIKKRRKRMAKKKHRKLLKKTRVQRRRLGK
jgi:hypothetical protein